ncbi:hypothetical protein D9757_007957 [Collybiopsis confluens]|uniref:Uncharacterized protein n=1 Tax=Collybiopsis confluens TaxID=2823264 RepID=A0A8H5M477_9AGAR|nr:hypothetical protein D9757_007957 [Collybiopsis confluens]
MDDYMRQSGDMLSKARAKEAYERVLLLDPRHTLALGFLGLVYHLTNDLDRAIINVPRLFLSILSTATSLNCSTMALESAANYGLRELSVGPDQFHIQAARLKEKFIRLKPESKDLFDFYINAAARGTPKGSLNVNPESMNVEQG